MCLAAERAANSGVTYAREDFNWNLVERRRGTFDWRHQDNVVGAAARYGITVLPILDDPPGWAGGPLLPKNAPAYARFTARAVARYGPGGTFWRRHRSLPQRPATWFELLNEPYYATSAGHTPDPAAYARLVAATTPVARAANRRARFLLEAETTYFVPGQPGSYDWIGGMYAAVPDLGRYFDGFAAHPYTSGSPLAWGPTPLDHRYQARRIEDMRAALVAHGDGAKHIWITEVGWSTCAAQRGLRERDQPGGLPPGALSPPPHALAQLRRRDHRLRVPRFSRSRPSHGGVGGPARKRRAEARLVRPPRLAAAMRTRVTLAVWPDLLSI